MTRKKKARKISTDSQTAQATAPAGVFGINPFALLDDEADDSLKAPPQLESINQQTVSASIPNAEKQTEGATAQSKLVKENDNESEKSGYLDSITKRPKSIKSLTQELLFCTTCKGSSHDSSCCFLTHPGQLRSYLNRHPGHRGYWKRQVQAYQALIADTEIEEIERHELPHFKPKTPDNQKYCGDFNNLHLQVNDATYPNSSKSTIRSLHDAASSEVDGNYAVSESNNENATPEILGPAYDTNFELVNNVQLRDRPSIYLTTDVPTGYCWCCGAFYGHIMGCWAGKFGYRRFFR